MAEVDAVLIAHRAPDGRVHLLEDHLVAVGHMASTRVPVALADWARASGRLHDIGKAQAQWQRYIRSEPDDWREGRVDHSSAGAVIAERALGVAGKVLGYAIAGHHVGLPDGSGASSSLSARVANRADHADEVRRIAEDLCRVPSVGPLLASGGRREYITLAIRLIFGALVDADRSDTAAFFRGTSEKRAHPAVEVLAERLTRHLDGLPRTTARTTIAHVRAAVLRDARAAATRPRGLYRLSAPTGGGKTFAGLTFALEHARTHGLRRVIVALPYVSIVEQTADAYRAALGEEAVVEHHSSISEAAEDIAADAIENWDAPVIVTTTVRLLETLFAAAPGRARRLPALVDSVIVIDEAQALPTHLLAATMHTLDGLVRVAGATLLTMTATPPALDLALSGMTATEIVQDAPALARLARRADIEVRLDSDMSVEALADEAGALSSVLVIVSRRALAQAIARRWTGAGLCGVYHLSTTMTGEHRAATLEAVKRRLAQGEPCRLVSTQVVEAGVDIDFPVVYRSLAGVDSIAQAAGRCNREGRLNAGRVVVVALRDGIPRSLADLRDAAFVARQHLAGETQMRQDDLDLFERASRQYLTLRPLDPYQIVRRQRPDSRLDIPFRSIAEDAVVIRDGTQDAIVEVDERVTALLEAPESRERTRRLQRFVVGLYPSDLRRLQGQGDVRLARDGVTWIVRREAYDEAVGVAL